MFHDVNTRKCHQERLNVFLFVENEKWGVLKVKVRRSFLSPRKIPIRLKSRGYGWGHYPSSKTALPASLALRHVTEFSVTACRQKWRAPRPHQGFWEAACASSVRSFPLRSLSTDTNKAVGTDGGSQKEPGSPNHHMERVGKARNTRLGLSWMNTELLLCLNQHRFDLGSLLAMTTEPTLPSLCAWLPHRSNRPGLQWGQEEETFFFFFSIFGHATHEILVPQPGIETADPALEVWSLNHSTTSKVPEETLWDFPLTPSPRHS